MLRKTCCLLLMGALTGCGSSQESQFYLLNAVPRHQVKTVHVNDHPKIGLGPVSFPRYLNQPQIVIRQTCAQLRLNEFHRWAEPLDDNTTAVIRNNLTNMIPSGYIYRHPWRQSDNLAYQIRLDITRFDADECGNVILEARWQILHDDDRKVLATTSRTYREHLCEKYTYNDLAIGMSQLLGRLSRDIALAIQKL